MRWTVGGYHHYYYHYQYNYNTTTMHRSVVGPRSSGGGALETWLASNVPAEPETLLNIIRGTKAAYDTRHQSTYFGQKAMEFPRIRRDGLTYYSFKPSCHTDSQKIQVACLKC